MSALRRNAPRSRIAARAARPQAWVALLLLPLLLLAVLVVPAFAQPGPNGIGFAQAEEGTWTCRAGNPVTALDCAREFCRAEAGGQDCYRTAWCYPARWAGIVTVWTSDFHSNHPVCGAPSLEGLIVMMRAVCDHSEGATACSVGVVVDPDGIEVEVAQEWTPQAP
ncbi:MAG: hypothetical protein KIS68_16665 [Bauldia sp.]|nr:hypothetical protein [Bauldia sp.]